MNSFFSDKRVLVTGACGTVGRELVRQLLEEQNVEELIALDNNESEIFFLEQTIFILSKQPLFSRRCTKFRKAVQENGRNRCGVSHGRL